MENNVNDNEQGAMEFDELSMDAFEFFNDTPEETEETEASEKEVSGEEEINTTSESDKAESVARKEDQEDEEEKSEKQGSPNLYSSFASALKEDGLFSSLDLEKDKITNAEELVAAVKKEIKASELKGLNEDQREYLKALEAGVPQEEYQKSKSIEAQIKSITPESITEENTELAEALLIQDFIDNGLSEEKAKQLTSIYAEKGISIEEAKKVLPQIQERASNKIKEQIKAGEAAKLEQTKQIEKFKSDVSSSLKSTKEIIEGIPVNEEVKKLVENSILKPSGTLENGTPVNKLAQDRVKDPVSFDIKLHYVYNVTKGFTDFSVFKNKAKSTAISELDALIKGSTFTPGGQKPNLGTMIDTGDDFSFGEGTEIGL